MSITDQITRIQNAKSAIKTSIENKGVTVAADAKLDAYPALIDSIKAGSGGGGSEHNHPDFFDILTDNGTKYDELFAGISKDLDTIIKIEDLDVSKVQSVNNMFKGCRGFRDRKYDFSHFGTIKSLYNLFNQAGDPNYVTEILMENVDFTNKRAESMFANSNLRTIRLVNCTLPYDINYLFFYCNSTVIIDLTNTSTANVQHFNSFFGEDYTLQEILGELDLSSACDVSDMFSSCGSLTTVHFKNIFAFSDIQDSHEYALDLGSTQISDDCLKEMFNELPDLNSHNLANASNLIVTLPTSNTLTESDVQVAIDKGWTVANTNY